MLTIVHWHALQFISANLHKIDHTKARPDRTASTSSDIVQFAEIEAAAIAAAYGHADDEVGDTLHRGRFWGCVTAPPH